MGIRGLWKELEPVEQKISLPNLAVGTGFIANPTGARGFRVGIDASGWIYRACSLHGTTQNPELVALFSRCSRLFRLPFVPFFVFDGPKRPSIKRGKLIRGNDHSLAVPFQQMLDGFGFQWITAPGEAEATLSAMTSTGVPVSVDAILTDDSDSFVFGASVVLRIRSEDNESYEASRYSAFDIAQVLGLSREDLILIAILAGGDYSDGLEQCGIKTAVALARAGLGRQLASGLSGRSDHASRAFLVTWRQALQMELRTNASGCLPHQYPQLAATIPSDFPDLHVIKLYLYPLVSGPSAMQPLVFQSPRLDILACFAEDYFGWGDSIGILKHFADQLFAGLVIREIVDRALTVGQHSPSIIRGIVGERHHKSTGYLAELRLMLNLDPSILTSALQAIVGRHDPVGGADAVVAAWIAEALPRVRAWAPKSMMEHVYPDLVLDYVCAQTSKAARKNKAKVRRGKIRSGASTSTAESLQAHSALAPNQQRGSSSRRAARLHVRREKRYTTMEVIHQGKEVVELITDSEGEY
ncbi:PIN domain-like protein [Mycena sanguinolenta]|nr:PIN domain-like protein [Mycena sanguinolenta]KAJ6515955.1 PIN domain-like protein [Mycena sanguinolenta]